MNKSQFKILLEHMYQYVNLSNSQAVDMISLIQHATGDKEELFKNIYFSENSPLKVLDYTFNPGGEKDYTGEMINISLKYDVFLKEMNDLAKSLMNKHAQGIKLFTIVLNLPEPYSQILYFKYYKNYSGDDITSILHMSKTTYYRKYEKAVCMAYEKFEEGSVV